MNGRRRSCAWKFVRPLRRRGCCQWRAWTRCYCRRSDWVVILATQWSCSGQDVLVSGNFLGGNSFTISVLVLGVDSRGFGGKGMGDFELAGNLKRLSFSGSLLLLQLLLLPPFVLFRSPSGSTGFLRPLFLTISGSGSGCIVIVVVVVVMVVAVVVAACRFALRVFLFARSPWRGSCIFSAHGI